MAGLLVCPKPCLLCTHLPTAGTIQGRLSSVRRFSDVGKGISPHLCHPLTYCLMLPILSDGADLFASAKGFLDKMEVHWCQVKRSVSNCFRSTPVPILAAELCLPPLSVLLPYKRRIVALRCVSSPTSPPPLGFLLCWLLGLFPLRSGMLFSFYCAITFNC